MFSFAVIAEAVSAVALGIAVHVVWWRVGRPKNDIAALFLCLILLPMCLLAGWTLLSRAYDHGSSALLVLLGPYLLACALGCTYIILFPGAQAAAPSMLMLMILSERGLEG